MRIQRKRLDKGAWSYFINPGELLMVCEQESDMIIAELQRTNLEVLCGKDLRQELEYFTIWKTLLNIHKNAAFMAQHK